MSNNDKKIITNIDRLNKHHLSDELSLPKDMDRFAVLRLIDKIHKRIGLNASQVKLYAFFIAHTSDIDWEDAKGKRVENPGGYLRGMSRKHANGKMKLSKTIRGLVHQSSVS